MTGRNRDALAETLAVFETAATPRTPLTASEVAADLDCTRRTAYDRLQQLADRGDLRTKKIGARGRVWWREPAGEADATATGSRARRTGTDDDASADWTGFEAAVDALGHLVYAFDDDGELLRWNDRLLEVTGYDEATVAGMQPLEFVAPDARERVGAAVHRVVAHGESSTVQAPLVTADGTEIRYEFSGAPIRDDDGGIVGVTGVGRDVGDRVERERELRHERDLVERILDSVPVAVAVFDADGDRRRANDRAETVLDVDGAGDAGEVELLDEDGRVLPFEERPLGRTLATGEAVTGRELRSDDEDRSLSVTTAPVRAPDGTLDRVVRCVEDVTRRRRQERRLQRQRDDLENVLDEVFDRIDDAFYAVDDRFRFTYVNEQAEELLQRSASELLGERVWDAFPGARETAAYEAFHAALDEQEPTSYELYFEPLDFWVEANVYPSPTGLSVYFRNVTERKERELVLEQYERIVETVDDGVYAIDEESNFVAVNGAFCEMVGREREELLGRHATTVYDDAVEPCATERAAKVEAGERDVATLEFELERADGATVPVESRFVPFPYGDGHGRCGVVRDVSDRIERERELRESEGRYRTLAENFPNGLVALFDEDLRYTLVEGTVFDDIPLDAADVEGRTVEELFDRPQVEVVEPHYRATLAGERTTFDLAFDGYEYQVWTVPLTDDDGEVVAGMVMTQDVTERKRRERALEHQREQLAALNNLNGVVRDVTDVVVDQSTREEIERTVCEALAASDSYEFAWIGDVDATDRTVQLRAEAGVQGFLDDATVSVDPDDPCGDGPTGRAVRTRSVQVSQHVGTDPAYEPWRDRAEWYGYDSSAAIPIVHEDTLYGVLNVYASRSRAFADEERQMVEQLGEIVGHAISAVERKRALMSDEVVELVFRIEDVFGALDVPAELDGTVTLDQAVPVADGEYHVYGTGTGNALDVLPSIVDAIPHWEEMTVRQDGDPATFELLMTEPPVLSTVASLGGYVDSAVAVDGDFRMTIHLSPTVDVRTVTDAVTDAYPAAELQSRRQVSRTPDGAERFQRRFVEELTDRQRAALESAYHSGFFAWPRESSGQEVAAALGVSPPTFHQHLRKAERKVFDSLLGGSAIEER